MPGGAGGAGGNEAAGELTLFLAGDVMLGRGVDQVLAHSVAPGLHEPYVTDARAYVRLAEGRGARIPEQVDADYVWGDALDELRRRHPDARVINLETAVTTSEGWWRGKEIHYRMHPANVPVLNAAGIDVAGLGNNHVMDWGRAGLRETLASLRAAGLATPGAGLDRSDAATPARLDTARGRLLVFAYATPGAGVPPAWAAGPATPGVNLLGHGEDPAERVIGDVAAWRRTGDRVVVSIHWGPNWGYDIPPAQRRLAHRVIDAGAADVVFGHSSHHPKGIEVHHDRLVLYGAGDFIDDYEGIGGYGRYRGELALMYFPVLDPSGALVRLDMTPFEIRAFRLRSASRADADWLRGRLDRICRPLGAGVERTDRGLALRRE